MQTPTPQAHRLLIIDDNPTIHEDIKKILCPRREDPAARELAEAIFGQQPPAVEQTSFQIDSAFQGQEGFAKVEAAIAEGHPYTLAFVDVRMPPGWDGIETVRRIWSKYPELQVVICTAYSDHTWEDIVAQLGHTDSLMILKKPFDNVEVLQLAHALTRKWIQARENRLRLDSLDDLVRSRTMALSNANALLQSEVRQRAGIETALRASEERFSKAFQANRTPAIILHRQTRHCVEANEQFLALIGRTRREMTGHTFEELGLAANPAEMRRIFELYEGTKLVHDQPCHIRRPNGDVRETLVSLEPMLMEGEECVLWAAQDVTELHQLEDQLQQAQKMEAAGQLAAGVAHDFNDLLTVIQCHTSLQLSRASFDTELADSLAEVKAAADRAASLTKQLLAFSRRQVMKRKPLDLIQIVERVCQMMKRTIGETMVLERSFASFVPTVFADETSVEHILINLIANARDTLPANGKISLHAGPVTLAEEATQHKTDARPGEFVCLSVVDTGAGIAADQLPHVFEPVIKPKNPGSGLGLATVYNIAKQHDGWAEVDSRPGAGTTFRVFLPVSDKPVAANNPGSGPGAATILLVEDETSLRKLIAASLTKEGYHVLQAADSDQARQIWQTAKPPVDLLIADLFMPSGTAGDKLADQLQRESNRLKVLYISGFPSETTSQATPLEEGVNFLVKPFTAPRLVKVVELLLKTPRPSAPLPQLNRN